MCATANATTRRSWSWISDRRASRPAPLPNRIRHFPSPVSRPSLPLPVRRERVGVTAGLASAGARRELRHDLAVRGAVRARAAVRAAEVALLALARVDVLIAAVVRVAAAGRAAGVVAVGHVVQVRAQVALLVGGIDDQ